MPPALVLIPAALLVDRGDLGLRRVRRSSGGSASRPPSPCSSGWASAAPSSAACSHGSKWGTPTPNASCRFGKPPRRGWKRASATACSPSCGRWRGSSPMRAGVPSTPSIAARPGCGPGGLLLRGLTPPRSRSERFSPDRDARRPPRPRGAAGPVAPLLRGTRLSGSRDAGPERRRRRRRPPRTAPHAGAPRPRAAGPFRAAVLADLAGVPPQTAGRGGVRVGLEPVARLPRRRSRRPPQPGVHARRSRFSLTTTPSPGSRGRRFSI